MTALLTADTASWPCLPPFSLALPLGASDVDLGLILIVDQRTGTWAEVVLDDGKVGWVPVDAMEVI